MNSFFKFTPRPPSRKEPELKSSCDVYASNSLDYTSGIFCILPLPPCTIPCLSYLVSRPLVPVPASWGYIANYKLVAWKSEKSHIPILRTQKHVSGCSFEDDVHP